MAAKTYQFDELERAWLEVALSNLKAVVQRKRNGEKNPEVVRLRDQEINALGALEVKVKS